MGPELETSEPPSPSVGFFKRVIQKHIVNELSQKMLEGEFAEGDVLEVALDKHGLLDFLKKTSSEVVH